jgi:membrane-associated phospholipid phosphatase
MVRLGVLLIVCSIVSIFYVDQPLTRWIHESFRGDLDPIANFFTWFGLGDTYFLFSVLGYLFARLFAERLTHLSWARRLAQARGQFVLMFWSFFVSGILVLSLKSMFGRCRPYNSPDFLPLNFQPFTLDWNFQSYPSGHTQVGFTLASFLSILYPKRTKYFFLFASLVGLSRVILEKHYLGDVLAGAYVGIIGTYIAWHWKGKRVLPHLLH